MRLQVHSVLATALLAGSVWAAPESIAATAQGNDAFRTLTAALQQAGLVEALAGDGPLTVFAPNDGAFAKAPAVAGDRLAAILKYHVVAGRLPASALMSIKQVETLQGQSLPITMREGRLFIGEARVLSADIECSNGVIHVIDRVLLPEQRSITEIATGTPTLATLVTAVNAARMGEALSAAGPLTVFAPTDAAFAKLPAGLVADLVKPENREKLARILAFHVVKGRVSAAEALLARSAQTLQGAELQFAYRDGGLRVGSARVVQADIAAGNGIIHMIDEVLLPPDAAQEGRARIESVLSLAIERGVPQFNEGNIAACAAIYEVAARCVVTLGTDALSAAERRQLEAALADGGDNDRNRAWALRRAFDRILAEEPAPRTESAFEPLIEAPLPVGFPQPGPVGAVVVKTYPRYRLARAKGGMFAFGTLFNHIKQNKIAMTAPVEMTMDETDVGLAQRDMAFLYANTELGKPGAEGRVEVADVEGARVLSFGIRGPLTDSKIAQAKAAIEARLGTDFERAGEWRMLGYNSPMVAAERRFWEIQLPIRPLAKS